MADIRPEERYPLRSLRTHRKKPLISGTTSTPTSPHPLHVLDDDAGNAVEYCIGYPDVHAFAVAYPSYVSQVLEPVVFRPAQRDEREEWTVLDDGMAGGQIKANPVTLAQTTYKVGSLFEGTEQLTDRWRATTHVDLLEGWQGKWEGEIWLRGILTRLDDGRLRFWSACSSGGPGTGRCGVGSTIGAKGCAMRASLEIRLHLNGQPWRRDGYEVEGQNAVLLEIFASSIGAMIEQQLTQDSLVLDFFFGSPFFGSFLDPALFS
ncbi:uncharacterized protein BCR38DRAFT_411372 [Pseudomassariella vexata]|uniref:Uncharacterized protein n=1 Tax=Pseudomassariella vexata TaxID=1141098 RepID=A0A1Y2DQD2_9PEZI|nr:uncharacterized protein BCR38DRAFT_411372 [Pseudomassariella vexata]ORY61503.1 hypothetical protein BCR38DRAFT_411372 [Pseudomassariella vexata]